MPTRSPMLTSRTAAHFLDITLAARAQAATATPLVDTSEGTGSNPRATDADGWIDCRSHSSIYAVATAAGAAVTITAEVKASTDAPALPLTLADGVLVLGTSEVVLDAAVRFGFIRFLAAGTVGGSNTVALFALLKG